MERLRIPLQWTHAPADTNLVTLHAGYPRFVDLVAIDAENDGDVTRMILQLSPPPAGDVTDLVVPTQGTSQGWTLTLVLVAQGAEPCPYTVRLTYDGAWAGLEPDANLQVEVRQAPSPGAVMTG